MCRVHHSVDGACSALSPTTVMSSALHCSLATREPCVVVGKVTPVSCCTLPTCGFKSRIGLRLREETASCLPWETVVSRQSSPHAPSGKMRSVDFPDWKPMEPSHSEARVGSPVVSLHWHPDCLLRKPHFLRGYRCVLFPLPYTAHAFLHYPPPPLCVRVSFTTEEK